MLRLVVCVLAASSVVTAQCGGHQALALGATYYVYSPNYPGSYLPNTRCHWFTESPPGTALRLNCYEVHMHQSLGCTGDQLAVSVSGDPWLRDGHRYCGVGDFIVTSTGSQIVLQLTTGPYSRGRFACSINVVHMPLACDCGWSQKPRIVGGSETAPNEYPMMAALVDGDLRILYCGSTIISSKFVITAAHCLLKKIPAQVAVLVGEHDTTVGNDSTATQLIISDLFIAHPLYEEGSQVNDIALVRLSRELVFSKDVGPACLPIRYAEDTFQGQLVTILGWGTTNFGGGLSARLKQARLKVIHLSECASKLRDNVITDKQICTFTADEDACQSDSGGPALWQDPNTGRLQLAGVISYGVGCASDFPGVNTRVGAYIDWIKQETKTDDYCVK